MSASRMILVLFAVLVVGALIVGGCGYSGYRDVINRDEVVKAASADIDVDLKRRLDLIDNVVNTVKGYAGHEKEIFIKVAEARNAFVGAKSPEERAQADGVLSGYMRTLLIQPFPELKADKKFGDLMVLLEGTENRISEKRRKYNDAAKGLNSRIRAFPGSLYAGWAGVKEAVYFQAEESAKTAPKVQF